MDDAVINDAGRILFKFFGREERKLREILAAVEDSMLESIRCCSELCYA
jgi:hypothetical protein